MKFSAAAAARRADATPHASALIESMRDIGYSLDTALADIIDNSITARATRIDILSDTSGEMPAIGILDNGSGMTEAQLVEAMRSEEHTSELQSLMRTSYAVFCLQKKKQR